MELALLFLPVLFLSRRPLSPFSSPGFSYEKHCGLLGGPGFVVTEIAAASAILSMFFSTLFFALLKRS